MKKSIEHYPSAPFIEYLFLKGYSPRTRETMHKAVNLLAGWCLRENIGLPDISYNDVLGYMDHCRKRGNKQRSIQTMIGFLKHYYNFLIHTGEATENPCSHVVVKGVRKKVLYDTFSSKELEDIYKVYAAQLPENTASKIRKVTLGLIVWQGVRRDELAQLRIQDVKMKEGKILIARGRRTNERELMLEAHQVYDLIDYINETRKTLLAATGKNTDALFVTKGNHQFNNILAGIFTRLKKQNSRIRDVKQLRASVVCNWLKTHNLRRVQYMAGHRYISSTEAYQANNMEDLQKDIDQFHPIG